MAGIFKSYDVRGLAPGEINTGVAYRMGKATAAYLKARALAVGRDARLSSPDIAAALAAGMASTGCDVLDLGMGPTPVTYFASGHLGGGKLQGAIQVTASHNPAEYNGFKFTKRDALPMSYDSGLADVEKLFGQDLPKLGQRRGRIRKLDLRAQYVRHCRRFARLDPKRPLKVAIDTGNGVSGAIMPELLKGLPLKVAPLFWKPDGRFPNHEPNPLKEENLRALQETVRREGCALGVAFDGDGDRVTFVDEQGRTIPGDLAGALMARELLEEQGPGVVFHDVRATRALAEVVREHGGRPIETRVGHSHIKAGLRRENALMAAELSGHYYFRDFYYSDNGEAAMFLVLSVLSHSGRSASELVAPLRRFFHSGETNFTVKDPAGTLAAIESQFALRAQRVSKVDGLTLDFGSWWFNLRPSNTEPVVRLAVESLKSREEMEARKAELAAAIEAAL